VNCRNFRRSVRIVETDPINEPLDVAPIIEQRILRCVGEDIRIKEAFGQGAAGICRHLVKTPSSNMLQLVDPTF
jgi:hypothetical protein